MEYKAVTNLPSTNLSSPSEFMKKTEDPFMPLPFDEPSSSGFLIGKLQTKKINCINIWKISIKCLSGDNKPANYLDGYELLTQKTDHYEKEKFIPEEHYEENFILDLNPQLSLSQEILTESPDKCFPCETNERKFFENIKNPFRRL